MSREKLRPESDFLISTTRTARIKFVDSLPAGVASTSIILYICSIYRCYLVQWLFQSQWDFIIAP